MRERMSYLNGLVDGLELSKRSKEGEVIKEITVALEEFAEMFEAMDLDLASAEQKQETQENRLNALERDFYGETYREEFYEPYPVEVECPSCSEIVSIEESSLNEEDSPEVFCPVCRTFFLFKGNEAESFEKEASLPRSSEEIEMDRENEKGPGIEKTKETEYQ